MNDTNQRRLKRDSTRQRILAAAARVFASAGFDAASMAGIASDAGLKKALVQYHFETKDNLWREAVKHLWEERDAVFPLHVAEGNLQRGRDALRDILRAIAEITRQHPEWVGLVLRESATPGPRRTWLVDNYLREDMRRGTEFIERAQAANLLPAGSPLQLLIFISSTLTYSLLVAPMAEQATGTRLDTDTAIDEQVDLLLRMLGKTRP